MSLDLTIRQPLASPQGRGSRGRQPVAGAVVSDDIDALLDRLTCVGHTPRQVTRLEGGLTNVNLRVTTSDRDVVVRISTEKSSLLAIDRDAEYANSRAAAESGASPGV